MRPLSFRLSVVAGLFAVASGAAQADPSPAPVPSASAVVAPGAAGPAPVAPAAVPGVVAPSSIDGTVVEASTGLGVPAAIVTVAGVPTENAVTDSAGKFHLANVRPGLLRVQIRKSGYQTTNSDDFAVLPGDVASITLSLQRSESTSLRAIAHTSTRASVSLQKASVVYKSTSAAAIEQEGYYRTGDYLRTLPSVSGDGGTETAGAGDDLYLDIRGIGALETVTLYDGHPIGYGHKRGVNLGYNFDLSPTFALRDVQLTYGSGGSDLIGVSAIGGIIDMRTLDPTPELHASLSQGYGTYANLISSFIATGPIDKQLSFALAGGVQSREGYFRHAHFIEPAAAQDPSAPPGTVGYDSGVYQNDSTYVNRGALAKLRYVFGKASNQSSITVHGLFQTSWADRTGNSDIDYQPYATELAKGNVALAQYTPTGAGACPAGSFAVSALNGSPRTCHVKRPRNSPTSIRASQELVPRGRSSSFKIMDCASRRRSAKRTLRSIRTPITTRKRTIGRSSSRTITCRVTTLLGKIPASIQRAARSATSFPAKTTTLESASLTIITRIFSRTATRAAATS